MTWVIRAMLSGAQGKDVLLVLLQFPEVSNNFGANFFSPSSKSEVCFTMLICPFTVEI